jgi:hypothetical protein
VVWKGRLKSPLSDSFEFAILRKDHLGFSKSLIRIIILEISGNKAIYDESPAFLCYTDSNRIGTISIGIKEGV